MSTPNFDPTRPTSRRPTFATAGRTDDPVRTPSALSATLIGIGTVMLFLAGRVVVAPLGVVGTGLGEWLFMALPVLLVLHFGGFDLAASLGLRPISRRVLAGGALLMIGGLALNLLVARAQARWIPIPPEVAEAMSRQLATEGGFELLIVLLAAAVTPAICEELLFRGLLLQAWRRWPAALAIAVNALAFGALHWIPGTGFRILPAAVSGALIAWAVWQTRSLWTGVWMHLLNNGLLLLANAVAGGAEPPLAGEASEAGPPIVMLGVMLAMAALGVHLLRIDSFPPTAASNPS